MEARRLLVRYVQRVSTPRTLQLGRQLDVLRLYSGELGCRLTQPEVSGWASVRLVRSTFQRGDRRNGSGHRLDGGAAPRVSGRLAGRIGRGALKRELVWCRRTGRALRAPRERSRRKTWAHVTPGTLISERPQKQLLLLQQSGAATVEPGQFTSVRYGERLAEIGATPSNGTVGDRYDRNLLVGIE